MKPFQGKTLSWQLLDGAIELLLDRAPCNEIGSATLGELEQFVMALSGSQTDAHAGCPRTLKTCTDRPDGPGRMTSAKPAFWMQDVVCMWVGGVQTGTAGCATCVITVPSTFWHSRQRVVEKASVSSSLPCSPGTRAP